MTRKKAKSDTGSGGFFFQKKKRRKSGTAISWVTALKITLSIMFLTLLAAGGAVGLIYLERYVKEAAAAQTPTGSLKLVNSPAWLNQDWIDALVKAAGGKRFELDDKSARQVARRLEQLSWLNHTGISGSNSNLSKTYRDSFGQSNPQILSGCGYGCTGLYPRFGYSRYRNHGTGQNQRIRTGADLAGR